MNQFAAFPAWISAVLLVAGAVTYGVAVSNPDQEAAWVVLLLIVQALVLSSFIAAAIAAQNVWRVSGWLGFAYVVVSLFASWCLWAGQQTISSGINSNGHPVGIFIGAVVGFLFIPASGLAASIAAIRGGAAGFSAQTKVCGLAAGLTAVSGLVLVIPVSRMLGATYGVVIAFLLFGGIALIGWWLGIGATARQAALAGTPPSP